MNIRRQAERPLSRKTPWPRKILSVFPTEALAINDASFLHFRTNSKNAKYVIQIIVNGKSAEEVEIYPDHNAHEDEQIRISIVTPSSIDA